MHFFCHFALWFGLLFANPVFVAAHNREDLVFAVTPFALWAGLACLLASLASWSLARRFSPAAQSRTALFMLTAAFVTAIQGNLVHDLFNYGAFNGERVDYSAYGWKYWLELLAWLAAFPLLYRLFSRLKAIPAWLPMLPVASFSILLAPVLMSPAEALPAAQEETVDPSIFEFSSVANLVHLLPDGFQGDVVRQVLDENPALAAKFTGFTLFTDNVGTNQGTAPALYAMLTGEAFDFSQGFSYPVVSPYIREHSYPNRLSEAGYRLDYVPVSGIICPPQANSCVARPFNDMKARGLYRHRGEDIQYSVRLIADLGLFRLVPMFLKEKVHNDGRWFFADTTMDGSSPWPDPVIREWAENLQVIHDRPVYKWHHFVGTHVPAKWDAGCTLLDEPSTDRSAYLGQAECVLGGIAHLLQRLDEAGVYDQTAMIVSGDHGHNTGADDAHGDWLNSAMTPGLHGTGRPALLVKQRNDRSPLAYSDLPVSVMDVRPTALWLAGVDPAAPSAFEVAPQQDRPRHYRVYSTTEFYSGKPVPYVEYSVVQPASARNTWLITDIRSFAAPPAMFDPVNRPNARGWVHGASLHRSPGKNESSWITGHQLAFEIALPGDGKQRELEVNLHLPEWLDGQTFFAHIDEFGGWLSPELDAAGERWKTVRIPIPEEAQKRERIFVSLTFARLGSPPGEDWKTAGQVQSIRTVPANQAGGVHQ